MYVFFIQRKIVKDLSPILKKRKIEYEFKTARLRFSSMAVCPNKPFTNGSRTMRRVVVSIKKHRKKSYHKKSMATFPKVSLSETSITSAALRADMGNAASANERWVQR